MKYFYVERENYMDGNTDGYFCITAESLESLLKTLERSEDWFPAAGPYCPRVYEITEERFDSFPFCVEPGQQPVYEECEEEAK